jgi:Zn finger protein HypA/HybF involved in hydrogenase expression
MKCLTCKTEMKCYDDVNEISTRIDWVKCPKCGSIAEIIYGNNGEYISEVNWKR